MTTRGFRWMNFLNRSQSLVALDCLQGWKRRRPELACLENQTDLEIARRIALQEFHLRQVERIEMKVIVEKRTRQAREQYFVESKKMVAQTKAAESQMKATQTSVS